ncbi:hypothetical protein LINPERHAP1_LOCUS21674 [Linum perenne]
MQLVRFWSGASVIGRSAFLMFLERATRLQIF